jgi:uncharacterized membrane protein
MDCYFHSHVPSVTSCSDCRHPICATCRDSEGTCPSCRLAARIDAAAGKRQIGGRVGYQEAYRQQTYSQTSAGVGVRPKAAVSSLPVSNETRALLALGYPLWPLALLALFDPKKSAFVRRHAVQALALNFSVVGMWAFLEIVAHVPFLGISAWPLLLTLFPVALVATVVYGFKLWSGDDVRVPLISDWLDERETNVTSAA